jgi:hypothetical protein
MQQLQVVKTVGVIVAEGYSTPDTRGNAEVG